jgi:serine/threonine protein phosphatase PrpC
LPVDPPLGVGVDVRVGVGERTAYRGKTIGFEPGATLLLYTDGLVERRDEDIEERLDALSRLAPDPRRPLEQLVDSVLSRFVPHGSEDDVAVLAARLLPMASTEVR